jgi:hypothetical protein
MRSTAPSAISRWASDLDRVTPRATSATSARTASALFIESGRVCGSDRVDQ